MDSNVQAQKEELLSLKKLSPGKADSIKKHGISYKKEMLNDYHILLKITMICPVNVVSLLDFQYHIKNLSSASGPLIKYKHAPAQERFTSQGHSKVIATVPLEAHKQEYILLIPLIFLLKVLATNMRGPRFLKPSCYWIAGIHKALSFSYWNVVNKKIVVCFQNPWNQIPPEY